VPPPPPPGSYPPPGASYPPPPPGAFGPADFSSVAARRFDAGTAISYGWTGFKNNIGPLALIALVVLLVNLVVNWISWIGGDSRFFTFVFGLVSAFVSLVISLGLIRAALVILDGGRPEIGDLLSTKGIGSYIVAALLVSLIVAVGFVLCIIPGLIAGFLLQFFGYAIVDKKVDAVSVAPQSDPIGAMRASYEITTKNVGELLMLAILCFVLNLVGGLLCGLGLIVSIPVTAIAIAYAWRFFSGGVIAPQA
jgi:uncharacterized membrane protein